MQEQPDRLMPWESCLNLRDLGGYTAAQGRRTRWGSLLRGDTLTRLNSSGTAAAYQYGIRTVIDLRSPHEIAAAPHPFADTATGVDYHAMPFMDDQNIQDAEWIAELSTLDQLYAISLERFPKRIVAVLQTIAHAPAGAVLFHCHAGKDRTGLIAMFLLALADVPAETIIADYALSEQYLAEHHREILDRYASQPEVYTRMVGMFSTKPEYMRATLDLLDTRYGGPIAYLDSAGLDPADQALLRNRLLE